MITNFLTLPIPHKSDAESFFAEVKKEVERSRLRTNEKAHAIFARIHPRDRRGCNDLAVTSLLAEALRRCGLNFSDEEMEIKRGPIVSGGRIEVMVGELPS